MVAKKIGVAIICVALLIEVISVVISYNHNLVFQQMKKWPYQTLQFSSNISSPHKFYMSDDHKFMNFSAKLYNNKSRIGPRAIIWPMPKYFSNGENKIYVSRDFELKTRTRSECGGCSRILKDGFSRFMDVITMDHHHHHHHHHQGEAIDEGGLKDEGLTFLRGINVVVHSLEDELHYEVDESYYLAVPDPINPGYALIEAQSVYGALHGLQTLSQLCHYDFKTRLIEVDLVPWIVIDQPRFPHRGLLIDTSRHYLSLPVIKNIIDSMTYAKLNVLHWHIVDSQSFPLEIPSYPKLWDGSYSTTERYTMEDAAEIVSYAQIRGVHVLAEVDVPGHAGSWGTGYPSLWPSKNCTQPLDVSNEFTFQVINGILSDLSKIFKYRFLHIGGDEVDKGCWEKTPRIKKWLKERGMNSTEAYQYFVLRAQKIAVSLGYEIINWEEAFINFGDKLDRKTVVQNWLVTGVAERVTAAGLRCIMSKQESWYLDHLDTSWQEFYASEPLHNITNPEQRKLVIGGEVCMWGENIDASDIEQTIWPRAAAAAERLWTPYDNLAKDTTQVMKRLMRFRCLLNQRGIAAAPLLGIGRSAPYKPGSCYTI